MEHGRRLGWEHQLQGAPTRIGGGGRVRRPLPRARLQGRGLGCGRRHGDGGEGPGRTGSVSSGGGGSEAARRLPAWTTGSVRLLRF